MLLFRAGIHIFPSLLKTNKYMNNRKKVFWKILLKLNECGSKNIQNMLVDFSDCKISPVSLCSFRQLKLKNQKLLTFLLGKVNPYESLTLMN